MQKYKAMKFLAKAFPKKYRLKLRNDWGREGVDERVKVIELETMERFCFIKTWYTICEMRVQ